jgi:hypothetical protein
MKPRLINVVPTSGKATGGENITIVGMDIDAAAVVDFRLQPSNTLIPAAAVVQFISFPNDLQHITVTTPTIPEQSGIPGDLTFFDRPVTIRVTNPPMGEYDELPLSWNARFIEREPAFTEIGEVLFYPERLNVPIGGDALFPTFSAGADLWRQTYEFLPDPTGTVDYKYYGQFDHRPYDPRHNRRQAAFGRPRNYMPFITRGEILKVVLDTFPGNAGGWSVTFKDDVGVDALQGMGVGAGPAPGTPVEFVPAIQDGYGCCHPIVLNDHMRFTITGAGPGMPPATYGLVHIYLGI